MSEQRSTAQTAYKVLKADAPVDATASEQTKKDHPDSELPPNNDIRLQYTDDPLHLKTDTRRSIANQDSEQQ